MRRMKTYVVVGIVALVAVAMCAGTADAYTWKLKYHYKVDNTKTYKCPNCAVTCQAEAGDDPVQCIISERHYVIYQLKYDKPSAAWMYYGVKCGKIINVPMTAQATCTTYTCGQPEIGIVRYCYCNCAKTKELDPPVRDY
mgnify:CR=1 FL=1